jgi:hypothetical protein
MNEHVTYTLASFALAGAALLIAALCAWLAQTMPAFWIVAVSMVTFAVLAAVLTVYGLTRGEA